MYSFKYREKLTSEHLKVSKTVFFFQTRSEMLLTQSRKNIVYLLNFHFGFQIFVLLMENKVKTLTFLILIKSLFIK